MLETTFAQNRFVALWRHPNDYGIVIIFLAFLITGCGADEQPFSGTPASRDVLRILDMNVWSGLDYKGSLTMGEYETQDVRELRYRALIAQIRELAPDIIGIHEANKLPDYIDRLAADLGYDAFYHVGVGGVRLGRIGLPWNLREGDAILTRRDLQGQWAGRLQLSGGHVGRFFTFHFEDATQVLAVRVKNKGRSLFVFATHWHSSVHKTESNLRYARTRLDSGEVSSEEHLAAITEIDAGEYWRLREAGKTIRFISQIAADTAFILMGDFNALPDSPEMQKLYDAGMIDAFAEANPDSEGFTWDPENNLNIITHYLSQDGIAGESNLYERLKSKDTATAKRVDFILYKRDSGLHCRSSRVTIDEIINGVHASDHYGVCSEIVDARRP